MKQKGSRTKSHFWVSYAYDRPMRNLFCSHPPTGGTSSKPTSTLWYFLSEKEKMCAAIL
jgi:hypothetical protein